MSERWSRSAVGRTAVCSPHLRFFFSLFWTGLLRVRRRSFLPRVFRQTPLSRSDRGPESGTVKQAYNRYQPTSSSVKLANYF